MRLDTLVPAIAIAFFCLQAKAGVETPPTIQDNSVRLVEDDGRPTRLIFGDGRVATLAVSKLTKGVFDIPFKLNENLCSPQARAPRCTYKMHADTQLADFIWTTHPDPKKIGQVVNHPFKNGAGPLFHTNYSRKARPLLLNTTEPDSIECDSLNWLPNPHQSNVVMKVWSGEIMIGNKETAVSENQSLLSYSDMTWAISGNKLTLRSIKRVSTFILTPPITDTSLILFENNGEECQVSAGGNTNALSKMLKLDPNQPITDIAEPALRLKMVFELQQYIRSALQTSATDFE